MKAREASLHAIFDQQGYWWLPSDPKREVAGTLYYSPRSGLRLSLLGHIQGLIEGNQQHPNTVASSRFGAPEHIRTLHGRTTEGDLWTLGGCLLTSASLPIGGNDSVPTSEYFVHHGLAGPGLYPNLDFLLSHWRFEVDRLAEWLGFTPFRLQRDEQRTMLVHDEPASIRWQHRSGAFDIRSSLSGHQGRHAADMRDDWVVEASASKPIALEEAIFRAGRFSLLLSLLIGNAARLIRIVAVVDDSEFSVFFQPNWKVTSESQDLYPRQMLAPYSDVQAEMPRVMRKWIDNAHRMHTVYAVVGATLVDDDLPLEVRFNTIAHGLESFHRHVVRVATSGDTSLKARLTDLLRRVPLECRRVLANDEERLVRATVATRHYYSHRWPNKKRDTAVDSESLLWLTETCRFWMTILMLSWAGMSRRTLNRCISNYGRTHFVRTKARAWRVVGD